MSTVQSMQTCKVRKAAAASHSMVVRAARAREHLLRPAHSHAHRPCTPERHDPIYLRFHSRIFPGNSGRKVAMQQKQKQRPALDNILHSARGTNNQPPPVS